MNPLYARFARLAGREPGRPLVREGPSGRWLGALDLLRRARRLAEDLKGRGVGRGSIGLVATGNRPAFIDAVLALWSLDAVVLPVEESLAHDAIERIRVTFAPAVEIRAGRAGVSVTATHLDSACAHRKGERELASPRTARRIRVGQRKSSTLAGLDHPEASTTSHPPGLDVRGAALIRMTSGSTGAPRGAVVTTSQAAADGRAIVEAMGITPDDVNVAAIPLSHSYGFDNVVLPLLVQGTSAVLLPRPLPGLILRALRSRRPVVLPAVPYLLDLLARHPGAPPRDCALRLCISAAAPLPPVTAEAFRSRFGVPVRNFYGSSETGGIAFDDGKSDLEVRFGGAKRPRGAQISPGAPHGNGTQYPTASRFVGRALPRVTIAIDRRGLKGLPPGEGRVVVSGPAVASRYYPAMSPDLAKGRFRTSDLGRLDEHGRLHLTGRLTSLINVAGRKVNPADVERALLDLEGVADAAVIGLPDPLRGEQVVAWVVTRNGMGEARIRSELARRLTRHEQPRLIKLVRRIPHTSRGKVDRRSLLR